MLKSQALQLLNEKISKCNKCFELSNYRIEKRNLYVFGEGNSSARLMIIGEAPGANEAEKGVPFCGKSGKLLDNIIKAAKWRREDLFVTNTIKCRPIGNREPFDCELENCRKFLDMQIKVIDPEWILCLGRVASNNLLKNNLPIGEIRGKIYEYCGKKVICTYHPSYVLQADESKQAEAKKSIWEDLQPIIFSLQTSF